jgi:YD repeat-containing protein
VIESRLTIPHLRSHWRWARAGVAVVGIGVLAAGAVLLLTPTKRNQAIGYEDTCTDPPPAPGPARPWEVDIGVSTYSSANTRSGNLFTAIPIIGWSGRGPDMDMVLYHNSANVDKPAGWTDNVGFDLGPGWTIAYSDQLKLSLPDEVTVVYDDGTEDVFTWNETTEEWDPPPGVHDALTFDNDVWRVTHKDQSALEFVEFPTGVVRLVRRFDTTGLQATITYEFYDFVYHVDIIADGSGRTLDFVYDQQGRLVEIHDPAEPSAGCDTTPARSWTFTYESGRMNQITDALGNKIDIEYDLDGRIETITDKYLNETPHEYTYDYFPTGGSSLDYPGRIRRVLDPEDRDQEFATVCFDDEFFYTRYFNRRGLEWQYLYFHPDDGSNPWFPSGNISVIVPPDETTGDGWW